MSSEAYSRRLATGTAINAAGAAVCQALDLAAVALAASRIGAVAFGAFVLAQGISQLPFVLESGTGQLLVRIVAGNRRSAEDQRLLASGIAIYLGLGLLALVVGLLAAAFLLPLLLDLPDSIEGDGKLAFAITAAAYSIRLLTGFVPRILVGRASFIRLRLVLLVRSVVAFVLVATLVENRPEGVVSVAAAYFVAESAAAAVGLWMVRSDLPSPKIDRFTLSAHIRLGRPMVAVNALAVASSRVDPVIVAVGVGAAATGAYGVVFRAYEAARASIELLSLSLMPGTAHLIAQETRDSIARHYRRVVMVAASTVWPLAVIAGVFAPRLIELVGDDLVGGPAALRVAMLLAIVLTPVVAAFYIITGADLVVRVVKRQVAAALVSLGGGVALVGLVGVPAVFLGSIAAALVLLPHYVRLVGGLAGATPRDLLRTTAPLALGAAGLAGILSVLQTIAAGDTLLVLVAATLLGYGAVLVCLLIPREDLNAFRRVLRRRRPGSFP